MSGRPLLPITNMPALPNRKLTAETVQRWGVGIASAMGGQVLAFPYRDDKGVVVAQKCRTMEKDFYVCGDLSQGGLFGQHLWRDGGRRVIVTEGEIDAMSVDQAMGHRWPVVSLPNGAQGARKALSKALPWLNRFEQVVLAFDMDEPGREAVDNVVGLFPPGKVAIVSLPLKDASDMLQADRTDELVKALWDAPTYRPPGILTVDDLLEAASQAPEEGLAWVFPNLNKATLGRRFGELVIIGAGTGTGKSTLCQQQAAYDMDVLGEPAAIFAFEQMPVETLQRVAGQLVGSNFHVWDENRDQEAFLKAANRIREKLFVYDHTGSSEWEIVREHIRHLKHAHNVRLVYIDNMTALCEQGDNERASIDAIVKEMANLCKELGIWICLVSHLASPEGKAHEEGGRVTIKQLRGSRTLGMWPSFIFGLERDQQAGPNGDSDTTLRVLKDRYTGRSTGRTFTLRYDYETNRVFEVGTASFEAVGEPF